VLFGGAGTLPDFEDFAPLVAHGIGAMLLIALLVLHTGAALHHQFVRRDGIFRRMWYRRDDAGATAGN
jgi:cytochrome b561